MPKSRRRNTHSQRKAVRSQAQRPHPPTRLQRMLRFLTATPLRRFEFYASIAASVLAIGGAAYEAFASPQIHVHDADPSASYVLPFVITDGSSIFAMKQVTLLCGVDKAVFEDDKGHLYSVGQVILNSDVYEGSIPPNFPINYPCSANGVLKAQRDGRLRLGSLETEPGVVHSGLKVATMCVWIGIKYKILGIQRIYVSHMFEWIRTPTGHQWLEGPIAAPHTTQGPQDCLPSPHGPFVRLRGDEEAPQLWSKLM